MIFVAFSKSACFFQAFKWLPVLLISAIVIWSYYAYVVHLCVLTVTEDVVRYLLLVLYHIIFVLFLWSYWRTVWASPGPVPARFRLVLLLQQL